MLILQTIAKLAKKIETNDWFFRLGMPISNGEKNISLNYLSSIGFTQADPAYVQSWKEAAEIIEVQDFESDWRETEEQLRTGLLIKSKNLVSEHELLQAIDDITERAAKSAKTFFSSVLTTDLQKTNIEDHNIFFNTAIDIFVSASLQVALVLAAGGDENHPFAIKFQLFENGRIPLGITGNTFTLY